ncbi:MAG: hypothetical protein KBA72_13700 [Thermoanaerobaculia bacterium]|nr:hypothetical protein [Thermoanaerobaculia bacterium]
MKRKPSKLEAPLRFTFQGVLAVLLLVLLVGVVVTKLVRAGFENSIWMDEVFSLELATKDPADIIELSRLDVHPPLYYLALRAWIAGGKHLGLDESIGLARSLNVFVWALLMGVTFGLLRRRASFSRSLLGTALMGLSPGVIQLTQDARSYGFALLGVTAAFLALALDLEAPSELRSRSAAVWLVYTLGMLLATSSHNLSWFAGAAMMIAWLVARWRIDGISPRHFRAPLLANLVIVAGASPWLLTLATQVGSLTTSAPQWMTPPTIGNFLRVFVLWLPLGRDAGSFVTAYPWLWLFVAVAWATLLFATLSGRVSLWKAQAGRQAFGLWTSILFVGLLWSCARWLDLPIFHGPRYPLLIAGIWATGIWAVLRPEDERTNVGFRGWLFAAPWLACGALSLALTSIQEARSPGSVLSAVGSRTEKAGTVTYLPPELGPYFRETLRALSAEPLIDARCQKALVLSRDLVLLNPWRGLESPASLLQISALKTGLLGDYETFSLPLETRDFELVRFKNDDWFRKYSELVCPALDQLPPYSASDPSAPRADLTRQAGSDGWSYLEFDRRLRPFRWTDRRTALLRFEGVLAEGSYELRLSGRLGVGDAMTIEIPDSALKLSIKLEKPEFDLSVPFVVRKPDRWPLHVRLSSDVKQAKAGGQESYVRDLGLLLREASVRRLPG